MLSKENELPNRTHETKKIMRFMSMNYEMIHDCPNDCIFYLKEYEHLEKCRVYERSWYNKI